MLLGWALIVTVILASVSPEVMIAVMSFKWGDKLAHATSYCVLMVWFAGLYARRHHGLVALALITLGIALELVQWTLPYRSFEPADMLANAVGVFIGLVLSVSLLAGWCQRMERRLGYHE
jgi:VanZ family protein